MPLKNKYLKHSPEITLEIFTLVYNKLIELGWKNMFPASSEYEYFKEWAFIADEQQNNKFGSHSTVVGLSETTVQEILGYDPFVKEDTIECEEYNGTGEVMVGKLYPNGHTEVNEECPVCGGEGFIDKPKEVIPEYVEYIKSDDIGKIVKISKWSAASYCKVEFFDGTIKEPFKHLVKPSTKEAYDAQNQSKITLENLRELCSKLIKSGFRIEIKKALDVLGSNSVSNLKKEDYPKFKELLDLINQPKPIEKWSVGSYVVFLQDFGNSNVGDVDQIKGMAACGFLYLKIERTCKADEKRVKWFATKSEAEEFAKTLVGTVKEVIQLTEFPSEGCCKYDKRVESLLIKNHSIYESSKSTKNEMIKFICWNSEKYWYATDSSSKKEYSLVQLEPLIVKQPLKQAVHCKTQEEWDFVSEKLNYKWTIANGVNNSWTQFNNKTFINLSEQHFNSIESKNYNFKILSFQEWCDLNRYKMKSNIDLTGRYLKALRDSPQSTTYKKGDIVNIFIKDSHNKYRIGVAGKVWWTYTTDNDSANHWELLPEDYKMEKEVKFEVGEYVILENAGGWSYSPCNNGCLGMIRKMGDYKPSTVDEYICSITGDILNPKNGDKTFNNIPIALHERKWTVRHATPEEINNHLISIGQIPAGEPLNNGVEPNKDGIFKYTTYAGTTHVGKTSTISGPLKMILSIDDEELPMVSIIKTNSIKQLLDND